ncbi:MAG: hypothetical protein QXL94_01335 [Candidatus Parvarchaeum sp.]
MQDHYNDVWSPRDVPSEDKTKWRFKPLFIEIEGEHVHCRSGYHYVKGYPTKNGYVKGHCAKKPRKGFPLFW